MLNYYFYNNFLSVKPYKRKKILFLHSFSQEFFFLFVNFSYFNLRKIKHFSANIGGDVVVNNTFFFVKVLTFFLILKKFYKLRFSLKIWDSHLLFLFSSLNSIFLKSNAAPIDISFNITKHNSQGYFSNKLVIFFKYNYKYNYVLFIFKYFLYSIFNFNNSVKISLLLNNLNFFKSYDFLVLFFYISKFTNKKLKRRRTVVRGRLTRHIYIFV